MNQQPNREPNKPFKQELDIQQQANNSSLENGMQAVQGNQNLQNQSSNTSSGNHVNISINPYKEKEKSSFLKFKKIQDYLPQVVPLFLTTLFSLIIYDFIKGQNNILNIFKSLLPEWLKYFLLHNSPEYIIFRTILMIVLSTLLLFAFLKWKNYNKNQKARKSKRNNIIDTPYYWEEESNKFKKRYYDELIYNFRDYRTQGLKTKGPFTLDLEKVFVPLRLAPECVDKIPNAMIHLKYVTNPRNIWDWLVASQEFYSFQSIAIIAPPGYGKTTLLEHLVLNYATNTYSQHHSKAPELIPIIFYLREIQNLIIKQQLDLEALDLPTLIEQQEFIKKIQPLKNWFEDNLRLKRNYTVRNYTTQKCLVMFDGLDEVEINLRQSISRWVNKQIQEYPNAIFLLTSRPFGYRSAPVEKIRTILEIHPFNLEQMQCFIQNWYLQNEIMSRLGQKDQGIQQNAKKKSDDLIERIKNNSSLAAMALNPLLLTMIATVHCYRGALPGRRVELYAEICDVMLGRRQDSKGINDLLTSEQKKVVLQVLALFLMNKNTREFDLELGTSVIQDVLSQVAGNQVSPTNFIKNVEDVCGLIVEKEKNVYEFAHKSFQEYLAAVQIKESKQEYILNSKLKDDWWHETIRLYAAQTDATNIISLALNNLDLTSLKLALDCQEESLKVDPLIRDKLINTLENGWESFDVEILKLTAQVKLARRLSRLVRIDEKLEIDNNYITCVEYQLFLEYTGEPLYPQHWHGNKFLPGDSRKPISGISWQDANKFCAWLTVWSKTQNINFQLSLKELANHYRLLTKDETEKYFINEDETLSGTGIRILNIILPDRYTQLFYYLLNFEWKKADEETTKLILKTSGESEQNYLDTKNIKYFPREDLKIINELWMYASKGHFGFKTQKKIYNKLGGSGNYNQKIWEIFGEYIGWRKKTRWLHQNELIYSIDAPQGHLPSYSIFPWGFSYMFYTTPTSRRLSDITRFFSHLEDCDI